MARQAISTGTAANDGTGDNLRDGGVKINANFSELYTDIGGNATTLPGKRVLHRVTTITANATLTLGFDYYILNKATALALTIPSGVDVGEVKVFTNKGAGLATITGVGIIAGAANSIALAQNEGCQIIWDGLKWYIIGNQSVLTLA